MWTRIFCALVLGLGCAAERRAPAPARPVGEIRAATSVETGDPSPTPKVPSPVLVRDKRSDAGEGEGERALFVRFPGLRSEVGWLPLGRRPSIVRRAPKLGEALGLSRLYVKDDADLGAQLGGSKVRKLEFLLGDARRRGCRSIVTFGGVGSNHVLKTAFFAKAKGFEVHALLLPQQASRRVAKTLLALGAQGARLYVDRPGPSHSGVLKKVLTQVKHPACVIPTGGSSQVGNLGYVDAGLELAEQVGRRELPAPDVIYIAGGTLGAASGLVAGLSLAGLGTTVVVVRTSSAGVGSVRRMQAQLAEMSRFFEKHSIDLPLRREQWRIVTGYVGQGYGVPTLAGRAALSLASRDELKLDLTYTAKALAALVAHARRGTLTNKTVLFWNTFDSRVPVVTDPQTAAEAVPPALRGYLPRSSRRSRRATFAEP